MAAPSMTFGADGGALASGALAAGASTTFAVDLSTKFEGQLAVYNTAGGTVAATSGLQVQAFSQATSTPAYENQASYVSVVPATASTVNSKVLYLPTGKWQIKLTNLDASNAITVKASLNTIDGVS